VEPYLVYNNLLAKRIITGLILIPILIALIYWGKESIFLVIIMLVSSLALLEFVKINLSGKVSTEALVITSGLVVIWFINYYQEHLTFSAIDGMSCFITWSIALITLIAFIVLFIHLIFFPRNVILITKTLIAVIGIAYVSLFLSYLILIRGETNGRSWIFFILLVIWFVDSGAYAIGNMLGKHQLCPLISPKKTFEGALGGIAASLIAVFIAKIFFLKELAIVHLIILALGIAVTGQLGDLCESTFKRANGLKDSGNILPGHGGMLDRIDSLLFVAPFVYYYKLLILNYM